MARLTSSSPNLDVGDTLATGGMTKIVYGEINTILLVDMIA